MKRIRISLFTGQTMTSGVMPYEVALAIYRRLATTLVRCVGVIDA